MDAYQHPQCAAKEEKRNYLLLWVWRWMPIKETRRGWVPGPRTIPAPPLRWGFHPPHLFEVSPIHPCHPHQGKVCFV